MFEWLSCLCNVLFSVRKKWCLQTLARQRNGWWWTLSIRMFLKVWLCRIIWYLFAGFKTITLCSVSSIWFMKYVFFAEIWFVKTSTRIVKYESRVVKSNPGNLFQWFYSDLFTLSCSMWYFVLWYFICDDVVNKLIFQGPLEGV